MVQITPSTKQNDKYEVHVLDHLRPNLYTYICVFIDLLKTKSQITPRILMWQLALAKNLLYLQFDVIPCLYTNNTDKIQELLKSYNDNSWFGHDFLEKSKKSKVGYFWELIP